MSSIKGTGDVIPMTINESTHPAILVARIRELENLHRQRTKITGQVIDETVRLESIITTLEATLLAARGKCEEWHEQISESGTSGDTVFGYCRECGTIEYSAHKPDCGYVALMARIDAALTPERIGRSEP